jgi:hypothetical protein
MTSTGGQSGQYVFGGDGIGVKELMEAGLLHPGDTALVAVYRGVEETLSLSETGVISDAKGAFRYRLLGWCCQTCAGGLRSSLL